MSETNVPLTGSDAWLLHAILRAAKDGVATLEDVVEAADAINHAMLTFAEIDGGLARLSRAGLVSIEAKRLRLAPAAATLQGRVAKFPLREAVEAVREALGVPAPVPPFEPGPADPRWTSGAFTLDDLRRAEETYRRRARAVFGKPGPERAP